MENTPASSARSIVASYFDAFNRGDNAAMEASLDERVEHRVNQGGVRLGIEKFREFNAHMARCYREELTDIVVFADDGGKRAAAEFVVNGTYLATDEGLPPARGQRYSLPAGSFFEIADGRIVRVTTYYNLPEWIRQVGG